MKDKWDRKYLYYGITAVIVCFIAIAFQALLEHVGKVVGVVDSFITSLNSVLIGLFIAYLMNPILVCLDRKVFGPFAKKIANRLPFVKKKDSFAFRLGRTLSIIMTLFIFVGLIWTFLWLVIPSIYESIVAISQNSSTYIENIQAWIHNIWNSDKQQEAWVVNIINQVTTSVTTYLDTEIIPKLGTWIVNVSSGVIGGVKFLFNCVVGLIVSVYVMASKERFGAQCKKMIYAFLSKSKADKLIEGISVTDRIFGGFISGKIVDSIIIGILCYFGMTILKLDFVVLISVIVGVTNVIPFFGPFIGAIPSALILLLVDPMQCLIFVIWVLVLQQLDGNVIGPLILGDSTGVNGFWIIVSISVGGGMFGVPGMIFGVPVFATIYHLVRYICEELLKKKGMPTDTDAYRKQEDTDIERRQDEED